MEEAPVPVRKKQYLKRKNRAVHNIETSLDSSNYDLIPPPGPGEAVRYCVSFLLYGRAYGSLTQLLCLDPDPAKILHVDSDTSPVGTNLNRTVFLNTYVMVHTM